MHSPRELCDEPENFGCCGAEWRLVGHSPKLRGELSAARAQHYWSIAIRECLASSGLTTQALAKALGTTVVELDRWLQGDTFVGQWAVLASAELLGLDHATWGASSSTRSGQTVATEKRTHGQFFTTVNPFFHPAFLAWYARLGRRPRVLEPFAGSNALVEMLEALGLPGEFTSYDIEPRSARVTKRDTLNDFPGGFDAVVTNPPYLARHFAKRKGLVVDHIEWGEYNNLYKVAIAKCLTQADYVAAIIPESYVTTGLFTERLGVVISLTRSMFDDTETPTCLALFAPAGAQPTEIWRGLEYVGTLQDLVHELGVPKSSERIRFNERDGPIGLRAVDGSSGPSIAFVPSELIELDRVNDSSRLVTRIAVADLDPDCVDAVIARANKELTRYRRRSHDVALTAFKGLRSDGQFRRRIDYETARRLLGAAVDRVERTPLR